jgi:hypothetical protein
MKLVVMIIGGLNKKNNNRHFRVRNNYTNSRMESGQLEYLVSKWFAHEVQLGQRGPKRRTQQTTTILSMRACTHTSFRLGFVARPHAGSSVVSACHTTDNSGAMLNADQNLLCESDAPKADRKRFCSNISLLYKTLVIPVRSLLS